MTREKVGKVEKGLKRWGKEKGGPPAPYHCSPTEARGGKSLRLLELLLKARPFRGVTFLEELREDLQCLCLLIMISCADGILEGSWWWWWSFPP